MAPRFKSALVVGGTGMLAEATRFVAAHSERVTLISRRAVAASMWLGIEASDACDADWTDESSFKSAVEQRLAETRPDLALLWIHASGHCILPWLLEKLARGPSLVVHVRGTASGDPRLGNDEVDCIALRSPSLCLVTVVLGSVRLPQGGRRWLTDAEISAGAIEAICTAVNVIVGEIDDS